MKMIMLSDAVFELHPYELWDLKADMFSLSEALALWIKGEFAMSAGHYGPVTFISGSL
jgi:hypothetical protein